jgi:FdhD protein
MISLAAVEEWCDGEVRPVSDYLVSEEPLEIRVGDTPLSVTLRTPGHDLELAAGFLFTEGLIGSMREVASLEHASDDAQPGANCVRVRLASGVTPDLEGTRRNFLAVSSCGLCGKASIEALRVRGLVPPNPEFRVEPEMLYGMPDQLRAAQAIFGRTGGLHAAGLFSRDGRLLASREDVGRHNAVDKVVGWGLLNQRLPFRDCVLMVSGRGGFEIVQKALVAGIPVVASVSAPSDMAVNLAREFGLTLIGFLRGRRFVAYSGGRRLQSVREDTNARRIA